MNKHVRLLRAVTFAAEKHKDHRRKDANASPYINHLTAVASALAEEGAVTDEDLILAAILHDTVEDTETTFEELEEHFGKTVADLVAEVTDDNTQTKEMRKQLQEQRAPQASPRAKQLKIADKLCNVRDIMHHPPATWSLERKQEYLLWTQRVVAGCRGVNAQLENAYDQAISQAFALLGPLHS